MTFFKQISELMDGYTIQITIKKEKDKLIVLLLPKLDVKKDEVQKVIVPLNLQGSAEQLDEAFFAAISEGLRKTTELQCNLTEYEASLGKAKEKSDLKKTKTGKDKPEKKVEEKKNDLFDKDKGKEKTDTEKTDDSKPKEKVDEATGEITDEKKKSSKEKPAEAVAAVADDDQEEKPKEETADDKVASDEKKDEASSAAADNDEFSDDDW